MRRSSIHCAVVRVPQAPSRKAFGPCQFVGDYSGGDPPVPIPNTAVKPSSGDGTAGATRWESSSLPANFFLGPAHSRWVFFYFVCPAARAAAAKTAGQTGAKSGPAGPVCFQVLEPALRRKHRSLRFSARAPGRRNAPRHAAPRKRGTFAGPGRALRMRLTAARRRGDARLASQALPEHSAGLGMRAWSRSRENGARRTASPTATSISWSHRPVHTAASRGFIRCAAGHLLRAGARRAEIASV